MSDVISAAPQAAPDTAPRLVWDNATRFTIERWGEIAPSRSSWLVKGLLPATGLGFIAGKSKAGKSFYALDLGCKLALAASRPATPFMVHGKKARGCGVIYVGAEDAEGCRTRKAAWARRHRVKDDIPFGFIGAAPNLLDEEDTAALHAALVQEQAALAAQGHRLGVVFVDTMACAIAGGDENSAMDMSRVTAAMQELARQLGCLVVLVAHFGKNSEAGIRGWSGLTGNADSIITVARDEADPDLRVITFDKVKNGRDGLRVGFRLDDQDTGSVDEDGDAIVSCVCVFEAPPDRGDARKKREKVLPPSAACVLQAVRYCTDHGRTFPPPPGAGALPHHRALLREDVKKRAASAGLAPDGEGRGNTFNVRFARSLEMLAARGLIRMEEDALWLV